MRYAHARTHGMRYALTLSPHMPPRVNHVRYNVSGAPGAMDKGKGRYAVGLDLGYKAKWPSASAHARHYCLLVIDILLCAYSCLVMRSWGFAHIAPPQSTDHCRPCKRLTNSLL